MSPYEEYLRLRELLALHSPRTDEPAEELFITVHQVSELWLSALLRDLAAGTECLCGPDPASAARPLRRIGRILRQMCGTLDLLTTMLPSEFATFRDALGTASAVQSRQYAEFVRRGRALWDAYGEAVKCAGVGTAAELYVSDDPAAVRLRDVAELLVDIDDALAEWRGRHLSLVTRQIGDLTGTGGQSAGYLRDHLDRRLFPELIDVRPELHELRRSYAI